MKKPNILLFLADQHRYDCVGCSNKRAVYTPNIDKLAERGIVFDNAYCPTPVCAPARQSFMSSKRAESIGALWNFGFVNTNTVQPSDWTISKSLKDAGYENIFVGAWDVSRTAPEQYGFDKTHLSKEYNRYISERYPDIKYNNSWFGEMNPIPYSDSRPKYYSDRVCEELDRLKNESRPWFIWVDGVDPHLPCRPSKEFYNMYNPSDIPPFGGFEEYFKNKPYIQKQQILNWRLENKSWEDWEETVRCYYAMITQIDHSFGHIIDKLKESGMFDDTLVIYTSDHGDMCGSHRMIDKHYVMYDDVLRVPMIISYPNFTDNSVTKRKYDTFVYNALDIPNTICDICGLFPNPDTHGRSLADILKGNDPDKELFPDYTVSCSNGQQFGSFTQRSIRTDKYKYIWNLTDIDEFYDLAADPYELENRISESLYKSIISDLRKLMKKELARCQDPFVKGGWLNRTLDEDIKL